LRKRVRSCSSSSLDSIEISMPVWSPRQRWEPDCSSWQDFGAIADCGTSSLEVANR
jgi:hypothetical protein